MRSTILKTPSKIILQVMIIFSIFMLVRGHNSPGGGFIGGLIASCALSLFHISQGKGKLALFSNWPWLLSFGMIAMLASFCAPMFFGRPALTGAWVTLPLVFTRIKLGTPLLFDVGVYLVVMGSITLMIDVLEK